jgi:hypothetical protein
MTNLQKAFPEYNIASLPPIPLSWTDSSYQHDECPSFTFGNWQVYIAEPNLDYPRFSLIHSVDDCAIQSHNWFEILELVGE